MSERCEPPPEWRHMRWHMLEADVEPLGWWPPKTAVWQAPAAWMGDTLGWSNDFGLGFDGPKEAAEKGWRYLAPVTPTATVAALVEALEWMIANDDTNEGDTPLPEHGNRTWNEINDYWIDGLNKARAVLALYRKGTER